MKENETKMTTSTSFVVRTSTCYESSSPLSASGTKTKSTTRTRRVLEVKDTDALRSSRSSSSSITTNNTNMLWIGSPARHHIRDGAGLGGDEGHHDHQHHPMMNASSPRSVTTSNNNTSHSIPTSPVRDFLKRLSSPRGIGAAATTTTGALAVGGKISRRSSTNKGGNHGAASSSSSSHDVVESEYSLVVDTRLGISRSPFKTFMTSTEDEEGDTEPDTNSVSSHHRTNSSGSRNSSTAVATSMAVVVPPDLSELHHEDDYKTTTPTTMGSSFDHDDDDDMEQNEIVFDEEPSFLVSNRTSTHAHRYFHEEKKKSLGLFEESWEQDTSTVPLSSPKGNKVYDHVVQVPFMTKSSLLFDEEKYENLLSKENTTGTKIKTRGNNKMIDVPTSTPTKASSLPSNSPTGGGGRSGRRLVPSNIDHQEGESQQQQASPSEMRSTTNRGKSTNESSTSRPSKVVIKESKVLWTKKNGNNNNTESVLVLEQQQNKDLTTTEGDVKIKIFLLLLHPESKIFELIQIAYPANTTTIGDILDLVPSHASEPSLATQRYRALTRPKRRSREMTDLHMMASSSNGIGEHGSVDTTKHTPRNHHHIRTAEITEGEILVAVPQGQVSRRLVDLSKQILRNPRIQKLLEKANPLSVKSFPSMKKAKGIKKQQPGAGTSSTSINRGRRRSSCTTMEPVKEESVAEITDLNSITTLKEMDRTPNNNNNNKSISSSNSNTMASRRSSSISASSISLSSTPSSMSSSSGLKSYLEGNTSRSSSKGGAYGGVGTLDAYLSKPQQPVFRSIHGSPFMNNNRNGDDDDESFMGSYKSWSESVESSVVSHHSVSSTNSNSSSTINPYYATLPSLSTKELLLSSPLTSTSPRNKNPTFMKKNWSLVSRVVGCMILYMILRFYMDPEREYISSKIQQDVIHGPMGLLGAIQCMISYIGLVKIQHIYSQIQKQQQQQQHKYH